MLARASNFPRITIGPGVPLSIFCGTWQHWERLYTPHGAPFSEYVQYALRIRKKTEILLSPPDLDRSSSSPRPSSPSFHVVVPSHASLVAAAARGGFNSVVVGSHYNSDHSPPSPSSPPSAPRILRERNKVAIHIALQATAWREASMLTSARAPIMTNYPSKLRSLWCADFGVIVILRRTTLCITPRARCCLMPGWPRTHSQHAAGNNERTHYSLPPSSCRRRRRRRTDS